MNEYYLHWYEAGSTGFNNDGSDAFVGSEKLDVTDTQLMCEWFTLPHHDDELDGLIVRASQRRHLQPLVKHQMDLNKYDYFVVRYDKVRRSDGMNRVPIGVISMFPLGGKVKVVKSCAFVGKVGLVIGYDPDAEEMVEIEFDEEREHEGKVYHKVATSLPPSYLEVVTMTDAEKQEWKDYFSFLRQAVGESPHRGDDETMEWQQELKTMLASGVAYNVRLKRKDDQHYKVVIDYQSEPPVASVGFQNGVIGVDINPDRIAVADVTADGNLEAVLTGLRVSLTDLKEFVGNIWCRSATLRGEVFLQELLAGSKV